MGVTVRVTIRVKVKVTVKVKVNGRHLSSLHSINMSLFATGPTLASEGFVFFESCCDSDASSGAV